MPEFACSDFERSLAFYTGPLPFAARYTRPGFAYCDCTVSPAHRPIQIMLEQAGNHWETGPLERPFGRGINLQIEVTGVAGIVLGLKAAGIPLFRPLETIWYRADAVEHGLRQVLVQDPDGYLLRFCEPIGSRPAA